MSQLPANADSIQNILDAWDRYESAVVAARRGDAGEGQTLSELKLGVVTAIEADHGLLGCLHRDRGFEPDDIFIILLLLRRLLSDSGPGLNGKKILRFMHTSTFGILRGSRNLEAHSRLLATGIVECGQGESLGSDILETEFHLGATFFDRLRSELAPVTRRQTPSKTYTDNTEYLLDLRDLAVLYRRRSDALFRSEDLEEARPGPAFAAIDREIREKTAAIEGSLEKSTGAEHFAVERFRKRFRLSDEELIVVIVLVFQEVHTGNAFVDSVDLLKLLAESERDLIDKRWILSDRSNLARSEIVGIEEPSSAQDMPGEVCLSPWAFEAIIGEDRERKAIDADVRLDFHQYIQSISDSKDFYSKLRLPPKRDV